MDLSVDEFMDNLLSDEAQERPSDEVKLEDLNMEMRLPEWFDEELYNRGRRFYWRYCFMFSAAMVIGLTAVFAVPSILKILVGTRRSNSPYTAYKRYISTLMHIISWHNYDLRPGTLSWQSLYTVRFRHLQASKASKLKGQGPVSQRDIALTQFGFIGFPVFKPDMFGMRQVENGDWEGLVHFWRTIGFMLGLEDRYNLCRKNIHETREVFQKVVDRVYTPCLENVPEYFEHTARVMLDGLSSLNGQIETNSILFWTRYLVDVPGYVYTEADRINFQNKLKLHLKGKSDDIGVDVASLIGKSAVAGLPDRPPRLFYLRDFDTIETTPAYKRLNFVGRYKLALTNIMVAVYCTDIGRIIFNLIFRWNTFLVYYFPYKAFFRFGIKQSFVNMFVEDPQDSTQLKPNAEYYKTLSPDTWYSKILAVIW